MIDVTEKNPGRKKFISIKGAKLHNLKNVSVEIPHNSFTVITGVSGSGKSSLAFDTLYAEGQRRFVESLSSYARQFLERMQKPDVDSINGIPPAIAIEQKPSSRNPRSTVGTTTEVYDYFRLLYGRIGTTICRNCGRVVRKESADSCVEAIRKYADGSKLFILIPLSEKTRDISSELVKYRELGYFRIVLRNSDEILDMNEIKLAPNTLVSDVFVVIDRIVLSQEKDNLTRLTESIESAFRVGTGRVFVKNIETNDTAVFSKDYECPDCEILYTEPEPRLFSFNIPYGACPSCNGFGRIIGIDENLVIPEKTKSIRDGAIHPFRTPGFNQHQRALMRIAPKFGLPLDLPYEHLPKKQLDLIWDGSGEYIGINGFYKMLEESNYKVHYRIIMAKYR
ncbi:MAG: excinuclease ABC subunit A, partial [Bacteroidota bacterium]